MKTRLKIILQVVCLLVALVVTYKLGYWAGLNDKGPRHRALVKVRRTPGNPTSKGGSYQWYDINNPKEAAKLKADEAALTAQGVEHYIAEGQLIWSLEPRASSVRVDEHL